MPKEYHPRPYGETMNNPLYPLISSEELNHIEDINHSP